MKLFGVLLSTLLVSTACSFSPHTGSAVKDSGDAAADEVALATAIQAALNVYLENAAGIQGSDPSAGAALERETDALATYEVTIDDSNDEGETWTVKMWVDLRKEALTVAAIRGQTAQLVAGALPQTHAAWLAAAKQVALNLYTLNAAGIQGSDPEISQPQLVTSDEKISTFAVIVTDSNDEGETWTVQYLVRVANADVVVIGVTETVVE